MRKVIDNEVEVLKTPDIQINQTNNFNILVQQLNIMLQQQQKQNEVVVKLMEKLEEK